ncbi:MAG TPA: HPr(Ser) kinase/phosphatase [Candidatus Polarisedimenticolia bacterium]|nr:HPr(Ser) kinase/phosphatase [Candidatus Polarisedimenticolia bacterium]
MSQREAPRPTLPLGDLLAANLPDLVLRVLAGAAGLGRPVTAAVVERPGLTLAGHPEGLPAGTIQVLGRSEVAYLEQLPAEHRRPLLERLARAPVACFIVSHGAAAHPDLLNAAERGGIPVLGTTVTTARVFDLVGRLLEERLAPCVTIHGTLIDIYGVGVLILGESGVGKSESALELILRGHRLVSDDTVTVRRVGRILNGTGPEISRYHMELRGIGIINIKDLYGVAAVRERKDVELVVKLDPWQEDKEYERLGLDEKSHTLLGVELPFIELPVGPGRNLSILLEVAARHHLLKRKGYHPAKELAGRIHDALERKR